MHIKDLAASVLPAGLYRAGKQFFLERQARGLRDRCSQAGTTSAMVDTVLASRYFRPDQKNVEISALLDLLRAAAPRRLCEIGGRMGGSLAMLAQIAAPDARILSIDIDYQPGQADAFAGFAQASQQVSAFAADSHLDDTVRRLREHFNGEPLDFLFIDGDHSLAGVTNDFEMYAPLVRPGGIVAFHDIVPDAVTRTGVDNGSYAGGVPLLWADLKERGYRVDEYVESWNQDGFGIGVIHWDGRPRPRSQGSA